MKSCLLFFLLLITFSGCRMSYTNNTVPEELNEVHCAISRLLLAENLTLGKIRESALTRRYYRPYIESSANSAFFDSFSEQYHVVPDSSLQRIIGTHENRDTIMNRLASNDIFLLVLPSINEYGELESVIFCNKSDTILQYTYRSTDIMNECLQDFSISNQPAFKNCVYEAVKTAANGLLDSLKNYGNLN